MVRWRGGRAPRPRAGAMARRGAKHHGQTPPHSTMARLCRVAPGTMARRRARERSSDGGPQLIAQPALAATTARHGREVQPPSAGPLARARLSPPPGGRQGQPQIHQWRPRPGPQVQGLQRSAAARPPRRRRRQFRAGPTIGSTIGSTSGPSPQATRPSGALQLPEQRLHEQLQERLREQPHNQLHDQLPRAVPASSSMSSSPIVAPRSAP